MLFLAAAAVLSLADAAMAQQLDARFSCGEQRDDHGLASFFADSGTIRLNGDKIKEFNWESSVFRSTHGLECSIDTDDGVAAEYIGDEQRQAWRIRLQDSSAARTKRGYDMSHGLNCTIRFERVGDMVHVNPSCPALCGSRQNFSEFSFDMKSGKCRYED
jgi:hypothetical protein